MNDNTSQIYTVDEIITILDIGRNTAYELINNNVFKSVRVGNLIRISCVSFNKWFYGKQFLDTNKLEKIKQVYKVKEIATILGIKKTSSYELIKSDAFHYLTIGGSIRVPIDVFDTWMNG